MCMKNLDAVSHLWASNLKQLCYNLKMSFAFLNAKNVLNSEFIKKLKMLACTVSLQQLKGSMSVCGHFWTGRICFLL